MMRRSLRLSLSGIALAIAAVGAYFALVRQPAMPEVRFATLSGELVSTADLRGKVTLVNFWATSCVPCVAEMPRMVSTYNRFKDRGFETIAVAMAYDPPLYVKNYSDRNHLPFKVAMDARGEVAKSFGEVSAIPSTFIIDRKGRIIKSYLGEMDSEKLNALLEAALRESA
jgi:peroxiredoxin